MNANPNQNDGAVNTPVMISAANQRLMHCADPESTRYSLGGVYFNSRVAAATNGRYLAAKIKSSDAHNVVIGFKRAKQSGKKGEVTYHPLNGQLVTPDGKDSASPLEGVFPRWQDCVPSERPVMRISLDASYLLALANALNDDDGATTLTLEIIGPNAPVLVRNSRLANGAGIIMPLTSDDDDKSETVHSIFRRMITGTDERTTVKQEKDAAQESEPLAFSQEIAPEEPQISEPITDDTTEPQAQTVSEIETVNTSEESYSATEPDARPIGKRVRHVDVDWTSAAEQYRAGLSIPTIARNLGITRSTVYNRLRAMGVIESTRKPKQAEPTRSQPDRVASAVEALATELARIEQPAPPESANMNPSTAAPCPYSPAYNVLDELALSSYSVIV